MSTRKQIDAIIDRLNRAQGIDAVWTREEKGRNRASVGAYYVDYMQPGDWTRCYSLNRMSNESGGVSCPLGHERMTAREFLCALRGMEHCINGIPPA